MDLAVSKLGEIGVKDFFPLKTERSIPQINLEGERLQRWRRLAREGAKVSGIEEVMQVHDPVNFTDLRRINDGTILIFSTMGPGKNLRSFLHNHAEEGPVSFHLFFGPEGGFSRAEVNMMKEIGGVLVTMGDFVLKAETASILGSGFIRIFYSGK